MHQNGIWRPRLHAAVIYALRIDIKRAKMYDRRMHLLGIWTWSCSLRCSAQTPHLRSCLCAPGEAGAIQPVEVRSGKGGSARPVASVAGSFYGVTPTCDRLDHVDADRRVPVPDGCPPGRCPAAIGDAAVLAEGEAGAVDRPSPELIKAEQQAETCRHHRRKRPGASIWRRNAAFAHMLIAAWKTSICNAALQRY